MNKLLAPYLMTAFVSLVGASGSFAAPLNCQDMVDESPQGIKITSSVRTVNKDVKGAFCAVRGVLEPRQGIDGKSYATHFEIRMPDNWQGRFAYQFNEGNDGYVKPALGGITGLKVSQYAINQGFAVLSSNGGHDASANLNEGLVSSSLFGHDPQARLDYAYASVEKLAPLAKQIVERFYQTSIRYAYGIGEGNGGRLAMVAATRYPSMFDGLLVGAPGLNQPRAALQAPWDVQILHRLNQEIQQQVSAKDLALLAQGVISQCDGLDGVRDNMVFAIDACQSVFKPTELVCHGKFDRDCIETETLAALINMHRGPHSSNDIALYSGWLFDTGVRSKNWRQWRLRSDVAFWDYQAVHHVLTASALANIYMTPPYDVKGTAYSLTTFLLSFDFDKDVARLTHQQKPFTASSLALMNPPDVQRPRLDEFKQAGGKMILFHGNSDPAFSIKETVRWYDFLDFYHQGRASDFVQFYRIPGMPHGQGGSSVDSFNSLEPLVQWVEQQQPAGTITAYTRRSNPEITPSMIGLSRPLCPYPSYAHYQQGDLRAASSFVCREG